MPTCLTSTGVTFPDSTSQATAIACGTKVRQYTAPATWTKPTGLSGVVVTVVAGGGGGGGISFINFGYGTASCSSGAGGTGGSVGGMAFNMFIPAPNIPGPVAVTVGAAGTGGGTPIGGSGQGTPGTAGGTSSFGCYASATGGSGHPGPGALGIASAGSGTIVAPLCGLGPGGGGNTVRNTACSMSIGTGGGQVTSHTQACPGNPGVAGYVSVTEYY